MGVDDSTGRGGTYRPAESGLAKYDHSRCTLCVTAGPYDRALTLPLPACRYFFAMLDDRDRNARYNEAIRACIDDFNRENPGLGGPRVLDVGVGTGFLSACCLLAGAKHVTGVDVAMRLEPHVDGSRAVVPASRARPRPIPRTPAEHWCVRACTTTFAATVATTSVTTPTLTSTLTSTLSSTLTSTLSSTALSSPALPSTHPAA